MRFVGCTRPHGLLESAPDAASWPEEPLAGERVESTVSWAAFWDEGDRYCVRAAWSGGEAWFAMVDDALDADALRARTPALPFPAVRAPRLMLVGARSGPSERVVLLARSRRLTTPSDRRAR